MAHPGHHPGDFLGVAFVTALATMAVCLSLLIIFDVLITKTTFFSLSMDMIFK